MTRAFTDLTWEGIRDQHGQKENEKATKHNTKKPPQTAGSLDQTVLKEGNDHALISSGNQANELGIGTGVDLRYYFSGMTGSRGRSSE